MIFTRNPHEHEILRQKRVLLVGVGSVGSAVAEMLVRAGIGTISLVDPDVLAPENLARHLLTQKDLGRPKAEAMADRLREINPDGEVVPYSQDFLSFAGAPERRCTDGQDHPPSLTSCDLLVSCVDSYLCESMINAISLRYSVPAIYIGCWGPVVLGEIYYVVPGRTPCLECFAAFRQRAEIPVDPRKYEDPGLDDTRVPGQPGLWANILAISGVAFQAILGILQLRDLPEQNLWLMNLTHKDFRPLGVTFGNVRHGCPVCDESEPLTL